MIGSAMKTAIIIVCVLFALIGPQLGNAAEAEEKIATGDEIEKTEGGVVLGDQEIFGPFLADPKKPEFSLNIRFYHTPTETFPGFFAKLGETFSIYRNETASHHLWEIEAEASVSSLFNLATSSFDLINSDFYVGFPVSWRKGQWSAKLTLSHQSSHLGDEVLLNSDLNRINLSFEEISGFLSWDYRSLRLYFGGGTLLRRSPSSIDRLRIQGGAEWWIPLPIQAFEPYIAFDYKAFQEHNFYPELSSRLGLRFFGSNKSRRSLHAIIDTYYGHSPHGQFYRDKIFYLGAGVNVDL